MAIESLSALMKAGEDRDLFDIIIDSDCIDRGVTREESVRSPASASVFRSGLPTPIPARRAVRRHGAAALNRGRHPRSVRLFSCRSRSFVSISLRSVRFGRVRAFPPLMRPGRKSPREVP